MVTRNVVLTEEQDAFVGALVASGRFQNASEALRAGLRLLEDEEAEFAAVRARLRAGIDEAKSGARASGTGAEAIERAFAEAKAQRGL